LKAQQEPDLSLQRTESQQSVQSDISVGSLSDKPAHTATLLMCRDMLLNEIDAKKVVGPMVEQGTLDETTMNAVVERKTKVNRNKILVQQLKKGNERMFNGFCDALRGHKKYTNVAKILEETFMNLQMCSTTEQKLGEENFESAQSQTSMAKASSETSVTSEPDNGTNLTPHQRTIQSCTEILLKDMDADVIVAALQKRGAVSAPMIEGVTTKKDKLSRNKELLQLLKNCDANTFNTFCDVLKNEGSLPIVAETLESTLYYNQLQGYTKPFDEEEQTDASQRKSPQAPVLKRTWSDLSDTSAVSITSATPFSNQPAPALAILSCR